MGAASFISGPLYESRKNAYGHVVYGYKSRQKRRPRVLKTTAIVPEMSVVR
jgi:hypothetical protein